MRFPADDLEKRLTEFQIVSADGQPSGRSAIARPHAWLHSESYRESLRRRSGAPRSFSGFNPWLPITEQSGSLNACRSGANTVSSRPTPTRSKSPPAAGAGTNG
jgi:hypothetical protein